MVKVDLGLPTTGSVVDTQAYFLRALQETYKDKVQLVYPEVCVRRVFHDFARNEIVEDFLKTDCDILWFLDSDITPSHKVLDLITEHGYKWQVAGATYPVVMTPIQGEGPSLVITVYRKNPETGKLGLGDCPQDGVDFVDGLATGCLFIRREVFSKLQKPYFEFKFDPITKEPTGGEDLNFAKALSDLGIQYFTDFSMICRHQKSVDLLDMSNYAVFFAKHTLAQHHEKIKGDLIAAMKAACQAGGGL